MILINFAHPITDEQRTQIEALTGQPLQYVIDQVVQVDDQQPLAPQVEVLVRAIALNMTAWQSEPIVINPPGYAPVAACLLAILHGLMGHFPATLRIRPVADSNPRRYEVAEVMNLQAVREGVRQRRR